MQGGCLCENPPGLRLDTTNVEIAATIAPRPLLMISATGDWTNETLEREYPAVRAIYSLLGAEDRVRAVRFTAEHNYNKDSREAMYGWMARWLQHAADAEPREEESFSVDPLGDLLVFHRRPLPPEALTASQLTANWIAAAQRQLATTPLAVRASALGHALSLPIETTAIDAAALRRNRKTVLFAGSEDVAAALRAAGFTVRSIDFAPFDPEAAADVSHFETYNRTVAGQRVADIVAAARANPGAALVASGNAALAGVLATAAAPIRLAVLDTGVFDTSSDADFLDRLYIPGLRRAGDVQTAVEMAGDRIVIHGAGTAFRVTPGRAQPKRLTPKEIVALLER